MIQLAPDPEQTLPQNNTGSVTGFSSLQSQDTILEQEETSSDETTSQPLQTVSWNTDASNL